MIFRTSGKRGSNPPLLTILCVKNMKVWCNMKTGHIGEQCKKYRRHVLKLNQIDVARETGYSKSNVSAFETGRNNNAKILLWYIDRGLNRGCNDGKTRV